MHKGEVIKKASVKAVPMDLVTSLKKWFKGARIFSVYEAGFAGFVLHRELERSGVKNIVINAASLEVAANDRVKTDSRDSEKMARQLSFGTLRPCRIQSVKQELSRLSHRTRDQFISKRISTGNQIKSKLFQFGLIAHDDNQVMSEKFLLKVEEYDLPEELKFSLQLLVKIWRELSDQIKILDQKVQEDNKKNDIIAAIAKVPGIGPLSANIIYTELGDMSQFSNQSKLFSFLGLTPSEYSSGEATRKGRITRQSPGRLRRILIEVTWRNIQKDDYTREAYQRISAARGGKRAVVACARKLIGRIRASVLSQQDFCYKKPAVAI